MIKSDMVEGPEFPHLVQRYNVTAVPKTVINETDSFEGALPAAAAYLQILKAVSPEEYAALEKELRTYQGEAKTQEVDEKHEYDVLIVGSGPAGMSAAVYTSRKGLDVALIAKKTGGQINYTANIENYLGFPTIGGSEMAETFRLHTERYLIAKEIGANVVKLQKANRSFSVEIEDGRRFKTRSVIFCTGKEYRRLGVPGEEKYIGRGIGFCATCDAPLYKGKKVAVVGGGNSAFTSARDLLNFAAEVHLIHRRKEFRADSSLIDDIRNAKNVFFHIPTEVKAFIGNDSLKALRIETVDTKELTDLPIDGVFLEVGLTPNSTPLKDLVELNRLGEVPVGKNQSTSVPGLFAAGDVTDVEEKQISVAVGQGATAGLSAYKYLVDNKLVKSKYSLKENWE
jgi:alkyl hydroperoxide reductase subunit F